MKKLTIFILFLLSMSTFSCKKDKIDLTEQKEEINIPLVSSFHDNAKLQLSKWLAKTCNYDIEFKKFFLQSIVNVETGQSEELFFIDFINRRYKDGFVKNTILKANNLSEDEFASFYDQVENEFVNLVFDVPDFVTWHFYPDYHHTGVVDNYFTFPFVFYPDIKQKNNNNKWTGFGDDDKNDPNFNPEEGLVLYEIGEREMYKEVIPLFIKQAEFNYVFFSNDRNSETEMLIAKNFGDVTQEGKSCIEQKIEEITIPIPGTIYDKVNIIELKYETIDCDRRIPPVVYPTTTFNDIEICDNGIDDDGDGEIDEEDCIYEYEVNCTNGIDDDNDGLLDGDDPDCDCSCLRDCRSDHNYLFRHAFDSPWNYYLVTSENIPGVEKTITLRYDITRLNALGCPPNSTNCPFTHNHKIVYDRATMLLCYDHIDDNIPYTTDMDPSNVDALCMTDPEEWSQYPTGFFYGVVSDDPINSDNPSFGILNGFYAEIIGANYWVKSKMFYLPASGDDFFEDWDASIYGDLIRVTISETDNDQLSTQVGESQTYTMSVEFSSKLGFKITVPKVGDFSVG